MGNFHKTGPTTSVHCRFTSLRRLWNMKPRSMKPAIMVLVFLVVSLVLNSVLLVGTRTPQELKGDTALLPSEPLTPQPKVQPTVIAQYPSPAASQKWASAAQERSDKKKVKGINSENNIKKAGTTMQPLRAHVAMTTRGKQKTKTSTTTENFVPIEWERMKANERLFETGYNDKHVDIPVWKYLKPKEEQSDTNVQELSFGFVNSNFKPPDLSQTNLVDLMGLMENSTKKKTGLNPGSIIGSVIGAVVEAKKFMSEGGNQDVQPDTDVNKFPVGEKQSANAKGATDPVNQNNTDSEVMQSDVSGVSNTNRQDKERENKAVQENAPKMNSKGPLRDANTLGTLVSKYGPSLFSLAFNTDGQTQSHDANSSPLMSFMGLRASTLVQISGNK
ncbi:uncharacterized protein LOC135200355 [Macrobrachium nipponense]|uniref:uncharacterized protein LOC135200355 n=1 Tax=Macrobrachium nipponense TaxID=159736 RepID=UPI0030C8A22F